MAAERFECIALRADAKIRRSADGRTIIGGAPLRLLRLTEAGAAVADRVLSGDPIGSSPADQTIAARLVDAGIAHPAPTDAPALSVAVVVPVLDDTERLRSLLASAAVAEVDEVVVVDDGSRPAIRPADAPTASLLRHDRSEGPGRARNTGWRAVRADVVVFLDADAIPTDDALRDLLTHFSDARVGIVAPRIVTAATGDRVLDRYEAVRSPLDLGAEPALVSPGGRVTYVPTAALAVRREVLERLDGFDPDLRVGEDVDFVWRAIDAGWRVRYEPAVEVGHPPRPTWRAWLRQRIAYGSAAAQLDERHAGQVAPVRLHPLSLATWAAPAILGTPGLVVGIGITGGSVARLRTKLVGLVDEPTAEAARLAGGGTLAVGVWLARALWRAWFPLAVIPALASRRVRRLLVLSAAVPAVLDWRSTRPVLDIGRYAAVHVADDLAYGAGVWLGAVRRRRFRCLLPSFIGIPGLDGSREP